MTVLVGGPASAANLVAGPGKHLIVAEEAAGNGPDTLIGGDRDDTILGDLPDFLFDNLTTNVDVATALSLDSLFFTAPSTISDLTPYPRAIVVGEGTGHRDFFSLTVPAGRSLFVDLDFGGTRLLSGFDPLLRLYDASGDLLAENDNPVMQGADIGSAFAFFLQNTKDSVLTWTNTTGSDQVVYLSVEDAVDGFVPGGDTYLLNVGVEDFPNVDQVGYIPDADSIIGGADNDFIAGFGGNDTLEGGIGDDTIYAGTGDDSVIGGGGVDLIIGGEGNDTIDGGKFVSPGTGSNVITGFVESNIETTVVYDDFEAGIQAQLAPDVRPNCQCPLITFNGTISHSTGEDIVSQIEGIVGTDSADTILGSIGGNGDLILGGGDDVVALSRTIFPGRIILGDGDDRATLVPQGELQALGNIEGGAGFDLVDLSASTLALRFLFQSEFYSHSGLSSYDILEVEHVIGSLGDDEFVTGDIGPVIIEGGAGADYFDMFGSRVGQLVYGDRANGPVGDAISYNDSMDGGNGADTLFGNQGDDTIRGRFSDDILNGGEGNDSLLGERGEDTIIGGAGADFIHGGLDTDIAEYSLSDAGIRINLTLDTADGGHATGDELNSIENIAGSAFGDIITGNPLANLFIGGDGNDTLAGLSGADTLSGGMGTDTADYSASNELIEIDLISGALTGGHATGDTLINIQSFIGSAFNDLMRGGNAGDGFDGSDGADNISGRRGQDVVLGGRGNDLISGGADEDTLNGGLDEDLIFGNGGNDVIVADQGFDTVFGGSGDDNIDGGGNSDELSGQGGADTLLGDGGADTLWGGSG
ncbi:MAG: calcium-binding protein, partial [Pseudomonadota bacterium]